MTKKLFGLLGTALIYFCVATVLSVAAVGTTLAVKGALNEDRVYRVLAALQGIDVVTLHQQLAEQARAQEAEQPSFAQQQDATLLKSLDLDLREKAIEKGILDLTNIQTGLQTAQTRFSELTRTYDRRLQQIEDEAKSTALRELLANLESMKPKQAKEQLVMLLDDNKLTEVVAILKQMTTDKRKKILAEFKTPQDADQLYEVLKNILAGEPLASEIQQARDNIEPFIPKTPPTTP